MQWCSCQRHRVNNRVGRTVDQANTHKDMRVNKPEPSKYTHICSHARIAVSQVNTAPGECVLWWQGRDP